MKDLSEFASQWFICLTNLSVALIFLVPFYLYDAAASSPGLNDGGPCMYKQYKGEAEIISVIQRDGAPGEYEIKFSFHPHETVKEKFVRIEGRQWLIVQKDSSYPTKKFITQHDIKTGKHFPCYLKVITKGTCTPVLFDFPTISNAEMGRPTN